MEDKMSEKIAKLESLNDQLETELVYIDRLMRSVGFSDGLNSVRETATNLVEEQEEIDSEDF